MAYQWILLIAASWLAFFGFLFAIEGVRAVKVTGWFGGDGSMVVHGIIMTVIFGGLAASQLPGLF